MRAACGCHCSSLYSRNFEFGIGTCSIGLSEVQPIVLVHVYSVIGDRLEVTSSGTKVKDSVVGWSSGFTNFGPSPLEPEALDGSSTDSSSADFVVGQLSGLEISGVDSVGTGRMGLFGTGACIGYSGNSPELLSGRDVDCSSSALPVEKVEDVLVAWLSFPMQRAALTMSSSCDRYWPRTSTFFYGRKGRQTLPRRCALCMLTLSDSDNF